MELIEKNEEELILELKEKISIAVLESAIKINKSALNYMAKEKQWLDESNYSEAEKFFLEKIPSVLDAEISKNIADILF